MTRIRLAADVIDDLDRIVSRLRRHEGEGADTTADGIVSALDVLADNPLVGCPLGEGARKLVMGRDSHGYVALYRHVAVADTAVVMAIRGQREGGYARHE